MMNTRRHTLELLLEHHRTLDEETVNAAAAQCVDEDACSTTTQETNVD